MIPLPSTFQKGGFSFRLISREGDIALFEKFKPCITTSRLFEVVIIQKMGQHTWPDGRTTEPREYMPSSEQWGIYGWSFTDIDQAWAKFRTLRAAAALEKETEPGESSVSLPEPVQRRQSNGRLRSVSNIAQISKGCQQIFRRLEASRPPRQSA
jgi:hypothetical protein